LWTINSRPGIPPQKPVFTWNGEWQIERKFVEYDHRQEGVALLAGDMPYREENAKFFT
jgi:hypothetical protein